MEKWTRMNFTLDVMLIFVVNGIAIDTEAPKCTCHPKGIFQCANIDMKGIPKPNCTGITRLDVHDSDIQTISGGTFKYFKEAGAKIKKINMTRCNISTVSNDTFLLFRQLQHLYLIENPLKEITASTFASLKNRSLTSVNLSRCKIKTIHQDAFVNLHALSAVLLEWNELSSLDFLRYSVKPKYKLKRLNIGYNNLKDVSVLKLHNNSYVSNLQELALGGNPLNLNDREIFSGLKKLKSLELQSVRDIQIFPRLNMTKLQKLWMTNNTFLTGVPPSAFDGLTDLDNLYMSGTNLASVGLHELLLPLNNVTTLDLSDTGLNGSIGNVFSHLDHLTSIDLSYNTISDISTTFLDVHDLNTLYLNNNRLRIVKPEYLPKNILRHLDISGNPFHCTCELADFRMYIKSHVTVMFDRDFSNKYICDGPKYYKGKNLLSFNPLYTECHGFNPYVITAIVVCVVLIVLVIAVSLVNSNKERIHRYIHEKQIRKEYSEISEIK